MGQAIQPQQPRPEHFPRPVLFAAAAVVAFTVIAAAYSRLAGPHGLAPEAPALAARDLRFEDRADGSVAALDAADGTTLQVFAPGTNAFVRATMRGLAQQRMREGLGPEAPFRLSAWSDGRLTLDDTATHRSVELEAFGHSNAEVFATLLPSREPAP